MKNETDFKKVFCTSVFAQKGYVLKLAMSSMSGLPDMYCVMPGFVPVLLEAKFMKIANGTFHRKIPYSKMQQYVMEMCNKPYGGNHTVAFGLVGVQTTDVVYCLLMPPGVQVVTNKDIDFQPIIKGNTIDVLSLFEAKGVANMQQLYRSNHEKVTSVAAQAMVQLNVQNST